MDSFKLGIFLMLIVGGTALGSGNEASKENTEPYSDPDRLGEPEEDETASFLRRALPNAGTVIDADKFNAGTLTEVLTQMGNLKRKIAIGVENKMGKDWETINLYFESGTSDVPLPHDIPKGKVFVYNGRKSKGPIARGCAGVIAFYIPDLDKTLSVMYSVPFDYTFYSNWWNVVLTEGRAKASKSKFNSMYNDDDPFKGDNAWHKRSIGSGLKVRGNMVNSGTPTLEIHIEKA